MYSKKLKLIYIHIPKTAGSSITKYLIKNDPESEISYQKTLPNSFFKNAQWLETNTHIPLQYYNMFLSEYEVSNFLKFSSVRHPLDKLKSMYFYSKKHKWIDHTIEEYIDILYHDLLYLEKYGHTIDYRFENQQNKKCQYNTGMLMRQSDFFKESDGVKVIKFETLQDDFDKFTKNHNLPKFTIPHSNQASLETGYLNFFKQMIKGKSKKNIMKIIDFYYEDFIRFDYKLP